MPQLAAGQLPRSTHIVGAPCRPAGGLSAEEVGSEAPEDVPTVKRGKKKFPWGPLVGPLLATWPPLKGLCTSPRRMLSPLDRILV